MASANSSHNCVVSEGTLPVEENLGVPSNPERGRDRLAHHGAPFIGFSSVQARFTSIALKTFVIDGRSMLWHRRVIVRPSGCVDDS
jgi:hypothetical protein